MTTTLNLDMNMFNKTFKNESLTGSIIALVLITINFTVFKNMYFAIGLVILGVMAGALMVMPMFSRKTKRLETQMDEIIEQFKPISKTYIAGVYINDKMNMLGMFPYNNVTVNQFEARQTAVETLKDYMSKKQFNYQESIEADTSHFYNNQGEVIGHVYRLDLQSMNGYKKK